MRSLVLTIAVGEPYASIAKITHPSLKAYAQKIGAEFKCIDQVMISKTSAHYEKFQIFHLLNAYDRIIYLDTDLIVRADTPNLFDIVPRDAFAAFNEGLWIPERGKALAMACEQHKEEIKDWNGVYYNTGVMVVSRPHKHLFVKPDNEEWNFYEQSYLNIKVIKARCKTLDLDYRFNRMSCMDKFTGEHRLCSYIVHYAGVLNGVHGAMRNDLARWEAGEHLKMRKNGVIGVGDNRLGDSICAEPVVRHIIETNPDCDFVVAAIYPEAFQHLSDKAKIMKFDDWSPEPDKPVLFVNTGLDEKDLLRRKLNPDDMNATDFYSVFCLNGALTDKAKQICLGVTPTAMAEAMNAAKTRLDDMIVVHPGRAWPSKTFPETWWNEVILGIAKEWPKVGIVGQDKGEKMGTVNVSLPDGVIDLRNLLGTGELFALLSAAPVLVSNDSAPVHAAGAFDNWIILIPTCKHPDLILPMRNGSKYYKAKALYKSLPCDENPISCFPLNKRKLDVLPKDILHYLPEPSDVVKEAVGLMRQSVTCKSS